MSDKTVEAAVAALERLASKLGVTAEHLWTVLVRQVHVEAITTFIWCGIWAVVVVAGALVIRHCLRKIATQHERYREKNPVAEAVCTSYCRCTDSDKYTPAVITAAAIIVVGVIYIGVGVTWATQALLNPEYYALRNIVKMVK